MELDLSLTRSHFDFNVNLQLPDSGITVLYGDSGCGKTTLLRCIAGLEPNSRGRCIINDQTWQSHDSFTPPYQRPIGYVFQQASLLEHLSVYDNLCYGMKRAKEATHESLKAAIDVLGIQHLLRRKTTELSGGESQRVAIARAIALNPKILLLDEPLASLDYNRKNEVFPFLKALKSKLNIPMIYVTHSPEEVAILADHLVIMQQGRVEISDSLSAYLANMRTPLRLGNELSTVVTARITQIDSEYHLACVSLGKNKLWLTGDNFQFGEMLRMQILSKDISLATTLGVSSIQNILSATVISVKEDEHPGHVIVSTKVEQHTFVASITKRALAALKLTVGSDVYLQVKSVAIVS